MSFARKLKNFFDTPPPTKHMPTSKSSQKGNKFFIVNKNQMSTEEKVFKALDVAGSLKGKTLYQKIAVFDGVQALSRPERQEIDQVIHKLHKEGRIQLKPHSQKQGIKYAVIQTKGYKPQEKPAANIKEFSNSNVANEKNGASTSDNLTTKSDSGISSTILDLASNVSPMVWMQLSQSTEMSHTQRNLCKSIAAQLKDKRKTLSFKQAYDGLCALCEGVNQQVISEDWLIRTLILDPISLEMLLEEAAKS